MFSATDAANFLACPHLTTLDRLHEEGKEKRPHFDDPEVELLRRLGEEHEQAYLRHLHEDLELDVVSIPKDSKADRTKLTIEAMKQGAAVIYQARLEDDLRYGYADFLIRVDKPSDLGFWSYEVVETKLARSTRVTALIQLCFYSDILTKMQGVEPELMHVVLGRTTESQKFRFKRYAAYFRRVLRDYNIAWETRPETYPEPTEHCGVCDWSPHCEARWRKDDHLSLVAGISRSQRKVLVGIDVSTMADLGALSLPVVPRLDRVGDKALENIKEQARIQVAGRDEGRTIYELFSPVEVNKGLAALPPPSPGDMFLDFEGDPFAFDQGLEYLIGVVTVAREGKAAPVYDEIWAFDPVEEKRAFEELIARIMERRRDDPGMHVYHFAPYEVGAMKRLAGRHATCTDEVDDLLRGEVFVDLLRVVKQGLRASVESYSIKKLEPLYHYTREVPLPKATRALKNFGLVLAFAEGRRIDDELRGVIAGYNRDDCVSTLRLRDWLESLRQDLKAKTGEEVPRPQPEEAKPGESLTEYLKRVRRVESLLKQNLPEDAAAFSDEQKAQLLLANLLEWHRREEKSTWWEYYRLLPLTIDQLIEDRIPLGGLEYVGEVGREKRSIIHRYRFPAQDFKIAVGEDVRDPATKRAPGEIVAIDDQNETIDIKRGKDSAVPHPAALIPCKTVGTAAQRENLLRLGEWVGENGIDAAGAFRAARDVLLRHAPRMTAGDSVEITGRSITLETSKRAVLLVDESVLPVQGPPGSGKTYLGARLTVELATNGRRVGITGPSHKVISNLLEAICCAARESNIEITIVQKPDDDDFCDDPMVTLVDDNPPVTEALRQGRAQIGAGTAWLWAREEVNDIVDVLFVDEAGQMSLANVMAISQAAKSMVLLGDPQQLDQPLKGVHPPGAELSVLSHLLNGRATIEEGRGLFLKDTWRLHPDVCDFTSEQFYDGRLASRTENGNQRLNAPGLLDGTGLRFVPVEHSGNRSESDEEVVRLVELVSGLLEDGATWTNKEGRTSALTLDDILIVSPYNAQVSALRKKLPAGARAGTVDKFKGQEAPVVFYSMATSSAEEAPRGMEFLYSLNRLNVAISRAKCLAVIVASPALFKVQCSTPKQAELANSFCRFLELAKQVN